MKKLAINSVAPNSQQNINKLISSIQYDLSNLSSLVPDLSLAAQEISRQVASILPQQTTQPAPTPPTPAPQNTPAAVPPTAGAEPTAEGLPTEGITEVASSKFKIVTAQNQPGLNEQYLMTLQKLQSFDMQSFWSRLQMLLRYLTSMPQYSNISQSIVNFMNTINESISHMKQIVMDPRSDLFLS